MTRAGVSSAFVALACGLLVACSSKSNAGEADAGHHADAAPSATVMITYSPTYTGVWNDTLAPSCDLPFCHVGLMVMPLSNGKDESYQQELVNVPANGPMCAKSGFKRVDPGHPETSLLYLKVTNPPCGAPMPNQGSPLSSEQIQQLHDWIAQGAQNN